MMKPPQGRHSRIRGNDGPEAGGYFMATLPANLG